MLAWRSDGVSGRRDAAAGDGGGGSSDLAGLGLAVALGGSLAGTLAAGLAGTLAAGLVLGSGGRAAFFLALALAAFFGLGGNTQFLDVVMVKIGWGWAEGEGSDMVLWGHAMVAGQGGYTYSVVIGTCNDPGGWGYESEYIGCGMRVNTEWHSRMGRGGEPRRMQGLTGAGGKREGREEGKGHDNTGKERER